MIAGQPHSVSPFSAITGWITHRSLIHQYVRRMVQQRYRGSMLGMAWALITPLLMLAVYSFVFVIVFKARWGESGPRGEFAVMLFSGLILHGYLTEIITQSPRLVLANPNFVKKVVFPLEILVPSLVLSGLFQFCISFVVLLLGVLLVYGTVPATIIYLPVILLPFILLLTGIGWLLASLGVFVRDIANIMSILAPVLLFLSTIFYPAERLPGIGQYLIYLNPLSFMVEQLRNVVLLGQEPAVVGMVVYSVISAFIFVAGYYWFQKTRQAFADIM